MEKIQRTAKIHTSAGGVLIKSLIWAAVGFAASFGKILGFPAAYNCAVAALSGNFGLSCFIGSAASYLVSGNLSGGLVQLCSMLVIAALKAFLPIGSHKDEPVYLSVITSSALILFGCVMSAAEASDAYTVSFRMLSALICGCVVFAAQSAKIRHTSSGAFDFSGLNRIYSSVLYVVAVSVLSSIPLYMLNAGRIVGTAAVLLAVRKYRNTGGAALGALTTCGILLCMPSLSRNTLLMAVSGLICGAFVQFGSLVCVLAFIVTSAVGLVAIGVNADTFSMFADIVAGSAVFLALPLPALKRISRHIITSSGSADVIGQTASARLNTVSSAIDGIRNRLSMVTASMDKRERYGFSSEQVRMAVCVSCPEYELCSRRDNCVNEFGRLEKIISAYNCLSVMDVEKIMPECENKTLICHCFNNLYTDYAAHSEEARRMREMREFLSTQLLSMENVLDDLSCRVGHVRSIDSQLSARVKDYFSNLGYPNVRACVYTDESLRRRIDVFVVSVFAGDMVRLTAALSDIADCDFDVPVKIVTGNNSRLSFAELPVFELETGVYSSSASGEYSGDTYELFDMDGTDKYVVLSDGMGTGKLARLDSCFAVSMMQRLIESGLSAATAQRLVNSMLIVKGWDESFATLDVLKIDLFSGNCELLKAGAAKSLLLRDGSTKLFGGKSFPVGILPECEPDTASVKLFDGDVLAVYSDGVDESVVKKISSYCSNDEKSLSAQQTAAAIGNDMVKQSGAAGHDDITVIIIKIKLRRNR